MELQKQLKGIYFSSDFLKALFLRDPRWCQSTPDFSFVFSADYNNIFIFSRG